MNVSSHVKLAKFKKMKVIEIQPILEFHPLKKNCDGPAYQNGHRRYQYVINLFMAAIFYLMHGKRDKYKYTWRHSKECMCHL